jgi:hypothetical protein
MKNIFWWLFLPIGIIVLIIYYLYNKANSNSNTPSQNTVQNTTSSQLGIWQWFPLWDGFTSNSLRNQGAYQGGFMNLLSTVSNSFGVNDGGDNPGVSVGGSSTGGFGSSGSGVGIPSALSPISSVFVTAFNQGNYALSALNNFDVLNTPNLASSSNAVDTGVYGYNDDNIEES